MAWTDIRGQSLALRILQGHLESGCIAPAYLFVGPEGVGKHMAAVEMAKALNCDKVPRGPCGACESCRRIARRVHPDLHELTSQGASEAIRIDEVWQVLGQVALRPFMGRWGVVILDGADRLTEEAGNLLLKTLEEPPSQARFFLITAKPFDCLPTIVSRCQAIRFHRLSDSVIEEFLVSARQCDRTVTRQVSRLAQGSLSQAIALATRWDTYRALVSQFGSTSSTPWLEWTVPNDRKELTVWLAASIAWLRDVAVASVADESLLNHCDAAAAIRRQAQGVDRERCLETAARFIELWASLEQFVSPRLVGTLMREHWLELLKSSKFEVQSSK